MDYRTIARLTALAGALMLTMGKGARADGFVGFYSGESYTRSTDIHLQQSSLNTDATFHGVQLKGRPFNGSVYYGIRAGSYFKNTPRVGLEFNFNHYKAYARTDKSYRVTGTFNGQPVNETVPLGSRIQKFQITNGINMFALNVLYRFPGRDRPGYPFGRLQPYVGLGPTYYLFYPINVINGRRNDDQYEDGGFGVNVLGGVRYGLSPHFYAFAEAKYNQALALVSTADGGEARLDVRSFHTLAGIEYSF